MSQGKSTTKKKPFELGPEEKVRLLEMGCWSVAGLHLSKEYALCPNLHRNILANGRRLSATTISSCLLPQPSNLSYNLRDKEGKDSLN